MRYRRQASLKQGVQEERQDLKHSVTTPIDVISAGQLDGINTGVLKRLLGEASSLCRDRTDVLAASIRQHADQSSMT